MQSAPWPAAVSGLDDIKRCRSQRSLLVASTGGHLDELYRLHQRFQPKLGQVEWVTFDTSQSRDLLRGEHVHFVPFVRPKDALGAWRSTMAALRLLTNQRFARVISTGAAVAVPFLAAARMMGIPGHYIESAARSNGRSLSGAMVARIPRVRLYGQYPAWTAGRWQFRGSVFDGFTPGPHRSMRAIDRVVVTFGTQQDFGFRRALASLVRILPEVTTASPTVLWQTGATDTTGFDINGVTTIPGHAMAEAIAEADLVIGHAGVGSALASLEQGKHPVLLPRRRQHSEHTDDHQLLIGQELGHRGLATARDPDVLTSNDLALAARRSVISPPHAPVFILQPD